MKKDASRRIRSQGCAKISLVSFVFDGELIVVVFDVVVDVVVLVGSFRFRFISLSVSLVVVLENFRVSVIWSFSERRNSKPFNFKKEKKSY